MRQMIQGTSLIFFEESCNVNGIFDINDIYKILTAVWPTKDIRNNLAIIERKNKCYETLKQL